MTKPRTALFFDTETTGLPVFSSPSEDPCQPRITQIAAELVNLDSREVLGAMNMLIKPDGWEIPEDVTAITGITTEKAIAFGVPIELALPVFLRLWNAATVHRVAHNETFDMRMVRIELKRSGKYSDEYADNWKASPAFCTCSSTIKIVNAPPTPKMVAAGRKGPKSPNLAEAYLHFTGKTLVGAHNAQVDIMACKEVYFAYQDYIGAAAA